MSNVAAGKDIDEDGEALNNVEKTLNKMGIALRKNQHEWKSFEDVLDEVADKWETFSDTAKSQISTAIAGTRQQEMFRALMNNYKQVGNLVEVAATSTGSATRRMEIYLDSVEAKTNQLKATWEEFIMNLNQSDSYKAFLDVCIWILNNMPVIIGYAQSLLAIVLAFKANMIAQTILNIGASIKGLITSIATLTGVFTGHTIVIKQNTAAKIENLLANSQLSLHQKTYLITLTLITAGVKKETAAELANNIVKNGSIAATNGLTMATNLLALSIGAVLAIVAAASIAFATYNAHIAKLQDSVKSTSESVGKLQDEIDDLDDVIEKYDDIIKNTKSASEQKELLTNLQTQLIDSYGEEAKAINLVNGKYEKQIELLKNLQKEKLVEQIQEYTNSQKDRDELLNKTTTNLVIGKDDVDFYKRNYSDLLKQVKKIVTENGGTFAENKLGDYGIWATGEKQPQIYEELEKYQKTLIEKGDKKQSEVLANMLNRKDFTFSSMKEDYEKFNEAAKQERQKDLAQFELDNWDSFQKYKDTLEKRQELYEQYTKATKEKEKKQLLEQLEDISKDILNQKSNLYKKINDSNTYGLKDTFDDFFKEYDIENLFKTDPTSFSYFNDLAKTVKKTNEEAGSNISEFGNTLKILDEQFENGKITASEYFSGINDKIKSIDINKINELYGGIKNLNSMLESIAGNTASYIETIMNAFGSGNMDEFEFFENLSAAINNLDTITTTIIKTDKQGTYKKDGAVKDYEVFKDNLYGKEAQVTYDVGIRYSDENGNKIETDSNGQPIIEPTTSEKEWDVKFATEDAKDTYEALGLAIDTLEDQKIAALNAGARETDEDIVYTTELIEDMTKEMNKMQEETKGLDDTLEDVKGSMKEIEEMDFKKLDQAYENLDQAFADGKLSNNVDMTLNQIDKNLKENAITMATFLHDQVNSSNEAYQQQAKQALDTMGLMADANVDAIATAIINNTTNLNAAANAGNKIASTAMGKTIQNLGQMLIKLGDVMDGFEISIPIKIPMIKLDLENFKNGGALFTTSDRDLIETEIKIGAASTIKSIGNMLANADIADAIGNMFTPIEAEVKKNKNPTSGGKVNGNPSSKKSGSGNSYTPADAKQDKAEILADIEKYEASIKADLYDQTEELINHYNLQKNKLSTLKEELDYYDSIYDSTENTTKWLETQNKLLANQSKSVMAIHQANAKIESQRDKIYKENSKYKVKNWFDSEGNETLAYGNLINSKQRKIEDIQEDAAKKMRKQYAKIEKSNDKDTIQAAKDKIKLIKEQAETKTKAVEDEIKKIEQIYEDVDKLNEAWKDNKEAIRDALQEMDEKVKSIRDELIDKLLYTLQKTVDDENIILQNTVTRFEQWTAIQEKYNDILNNLYDTQADLDSELQSNLDSYEYLDEKMRQLMFNEEDYKVLSDTISGIQKDITSIWADHYQQISNLSEDEMYKAEYITSETERQLEAKQKEYELAKAELDVAKAQTNLQNVQNERNTRMYINGQWVWTADPDAVKEAKKNLANAQAAKNKTLREQSQQDVINSMNKLKDSANEKIDKNNYLLEQVEKEIELQTKEVTTIKEALTNIKKENLPAMSTIIEGAFGTDGQSGHIQDLLDTLGESSKTLIDSLANPTIKEAEDLLKGGTLSQTEFLNLVQKLGGYDWDETTGKITHGDESFSASYKGFKIHKDTDTQTVTDSETGKQITEKNVKNTTTTNNNSKKDEKKDSNGFPKEGKVATKSARLMLRSKPSTSGSILKKMPKGAKVQVLAETNKNWAKVKYDGKTGYASRQYLTYDQGGLAYGDGVFLKDVNVPERVLSPRQTKAFETLVDNLTTNPVLQALTRNVKGSSNFNQLQPEGVGGKNYYFSNFTVQANDISEFINSLEGMIPISKK